MGLLVVPAPDLPVLTLAPGDDLPYGIDWTDWLETDPVDSPEYDWVIPAGLAGHDPGSQTTEAGRVQSFIWLKVDEDIPVGTFFVITGTLSETAGDAPQQVAARSFNLKIDYKA
ncbi:MAG: hypothetical protein ACRCVK_11410 [Aeromonas veronii]